MLKVNWISLFEDKDIDECYSLFLQHYMLETDMNIPFISINSSFTSKKSNPKWFNKDIIHASNEKYEIVCKLRAASYSNKAT